MLRQRITSLAAAAALAAGLAAVPGQASADCSGTIGGTAGTPGVPGIVVTIGPGGTDTNNFYLDVREFLGETYLFSIWVYQEDNGQAGLQRGGNTADGPLGEAYEATIGNEPDSCQQAQNPDAIVF